MNELLNQITAQDIIITTVCALIALASVHLFIRETDWKRWTDLSKGIGFAILAIAAFSAPPWSVLGVLIIVIAEGVSLILKWMFDRMPLDQI